MPYKRNRPTGRTVQSEAAKAAAKAAAVVLSPSYAAYKAGQVVEKVSAGVGRRVGRRITATQRAKNAQPLTAEDMRVHEAKMRSKGRDKSRPRFEGDTEGQLRKGPTIDETVRSAVTAMEEGIGKVRKKRQEQKQKKTKQLRKDVASGKYGIT